MRIHNFEVTTLPAEPIPQLQSGTIIASWVGIIFMLLGLLGVAVRPETQSAWVNLAEQAAPLVGGLVAFLAAWWRRRRSVAPIQGAPNDPAVMGQEKVRSLLRQ